MPQECPGAFKLAPDVAARRALPGSVVHGRGRPRNTSAQVHGIVDAHDRRTWIAAGPGKLSWSRSGFSNTPACSVRGDRRKGQGNFMTRWLTLYALAVTGLAATGLAATAATAAAQSSVQAGVLKCHGAAATSYLVGSSHWLACVFASAAGPQYRYDGTVYRVGFDVGFTQESALQWAVFASTHQIGPGDLGGNYGGVTAGAAVGIGGNANALVGGSNNSFALQPLSFEGQTGLNVAVGVAGLKLQPVEEPIHRRARRVAHHHQPHPHARVS
jgi:hypothetical protein